MRYAWLVALLLTSVTTVACDVCSVYMGITPNDYQHQFGIVYRTRLLEGYVTMMTDNSTTTGTTRMGGLKHIAHIDEPTFEEGWVKEIYNVYELRGKYFFNQRWSAMATLPVVNNYRSIKGTTQFDIYGVGDPVLLGNYQLLNTKTNPGDTTGVGHRLTIGGGVKLPLGSTYHNYNGKKADLDMQPGTGSIDGLISLEYLVRKQKIGLNASYIMKINTANSHQYRYGDQHNVSGHLFYLLSGKALTVMPNAGVYGEFAGPDKEGSEQLKDTGGTTLFLSFGTDVFWKSFSINGSYQTPFNTALYGGQVPTSNRIIVGITYNFKSVN